MLSCVWACEVVLTVPCTSAQHFGRDSSVVSVSVAGMPCTDATLCHGMCARCQSTAQCDPGFICVNFNTAEPMCLRRCSADFSCPCGTTCHHFGSSSARFLCLRATGSELCAPFPGTKAASSTPPPNGTFVDLVECSVSQAPCQRQLTGVVPTAGPAGVAGVVAVARAGVASASTDVDPTTFTVTTPQCTTVSDCTGGAMGPHSSCAGEWSCQGGCCVQQQSAPGSGANCETQLVGLLGNVSVSARREGWPVVAGGTLMALPSPAVALSESEGAQGFSSGVGVPPPISGGNVVATGMEAAMGTLPTDTVSSASRTLCCLHPLSGVLTAELVHTGVDDVPLDTVELEFDWVFYGTRSKRILISPNGFLQVPGSPYCANAFAQVGCDLSSSYRGVIAPLLADLNPAASPLARVRRMPYTVARLLLVCEGSFQLWLLRRSW